MGSKRVLVAVIAAVLVLSACGGDDGGEETTEDTNATSQTSSDSDNGGGDDSSGSSGSGTTGEDARADAVGAGADFSVAVPGGWDIDALAEIEEQGASGFAGGVQLYYPSGDFDSVVAFYDEWTSSESDEYVRSESGEVVVFSKGSPLVQISINRDVEYQGQTYTFLAVTTADS